MLRLSGVARQIQGCVQGSTEVLRGMHSGTHRGVRKRDAYIRGTCRCAQQVCTGVRIELHVGVNIEVKELETVVL